MSETADHTVRITPAAHKRLKQAAAWAGGDGALSLAEAAGFAIDNYWRLLRRTEEVKRDARRVASKARRDGRGSER